jgi:uncharacterized metal-binding protein YceD (DUF177 family)
MDARVPYTLPIKGLQDGTHTFDYEVDAAFFATFTDSPVQEAAITLAVRLDKRPSLLVLDFDFVGTIGTPCDRCLADIHLPVAGNNRLLVKYGEDSDEGDDEDVVYIARDTSQWNIAQFVYEYILLAVPLIKTYDCAADDPQPCDLETLERLEADAADEAPETPEDNPIWDALKDWKKD